MSSSSGYLKKIAGRLLDSRPTLQCVTRGRRLSLEAVGSRDKIPHQTVAGKRVGKMLGGHPVFLLDEDQLRHRAIQVKARLVHR